MSTDKEWLMYRRSRDIETNFMRTLARLDLPKWDYNKPRNIVTVVKSVRCFTGTLTKLGIMDGSLGLKDAKEYADRNWENMWYREAALRL